MAYQGGRSLMDMGQQFQNNAINTRTAQRRIQEEPEKTAGGALGATAGMAVAGFAIGGPWGAAGGAVVGLASYLLS
jgi:hypothetical protein